MTEPTDLSLAALTAAFRTGGLSPSDAADAYLARIQAMNLGLNAYVSVYANEARAAAAASTDRYRNGAALGPIDGAPVALKDNIDIAGRQTANGCAFGASPAEDAAATERLKASGAVILGKLNQHELALGATTDNAHWGQAHNPARQGWTPGCSSGGSGAAVAAKLAAATLGTDTMGSVRIPAAFCGCYGIKPTYGLVSTRGVSPLAFSLDHVGPLARTAEDCALMLEALAGFDPASPDSRKVSLDRRPTDLAGLTFGIVQEIEAAEMDPAVRATLQRFQGRLDALGAQPMHIQWPGYEPTRARLAGLLVCEADSAFVYADDLRDRPERFSDDIRAMLEYGARAPAAKLAAAHRQIAEARRLVLNSFRQADILVLPTAPMPPFPFDGPHPANQADFAAPANFAGAPAVNIPAGGTEDGLPIGVQIVGPPGSDFRLLSLARALSDT